MAYQVMTEADKINYKFLGREEQGYKPNYDELIKKSSCEGEAEAWKRTKNLSYEFAFTFRFVGAYRHKCGHWEILQHPYIEGYQTAEEIDEEFKKEAAGRRCTRCTCNWTF